MRALHVVALVEGVDGDLPVRRQHRRQVGAEVEPVEVVRREQRGQRVEEVEQGGAPGVETHPDEAAPPVHAHGLQAGAFGIRVELVGIHHLDESAVEVVAPGVVAAPDAAIREECRSPRPAGSHVQARVVEGPDDIRGGADDQDRLVADQVLAERHRPPRSPLPGRPPARRGTTGGRIRGMPIRGSCSGRVGMVLSSPINTLSRSMSPFSSDRSASPAPMLGRVDRQRLVPCRHRIRVSSLRPDPPVRGR